MITDTFILACFDHGDKVRWKTLYYLLTGKKTASTLFYGFMTNNLAYFATAKQLSEAAFTQSIQRLAKRKELELLEENFVTITSDGLKNISEEKLFRASLKNLNGFQFGKLDSKYWESLLFLTQIVSELAYENKNYLPVETNPYRQRQIKLWLRKLKMQRQALILEVYQEWHQLLSLCDEWLAEDFSRQLSGGNQVGVTFQQQVLSRSKQEKIGDYYWQQMDGRHLLYQEILQDSEKYPVFFSLLKEIEGEDLLQSQKKTVKLFYSGKTLEEIQEIRQLKRGTVIDHLLEVAIYQEDFPCERIFSQYQQVLDKFSLENKKISGWQFHEFQKRYPEVSYEAFRFYQIHGIWKERKS